MQKTSLNLISAINLSLLLLITGCESEIKVKGRDVAAATCGSIHSFSDLMASMAYKSDNSTINLLSQIDVDARVRGTLTQEGSADAVFTSNHVLVPNPFTDHDGRYNDYGGIESKHYLKTVKGGRPDKICGISGSVQDRVDDCATENGAKAIYEGQKYGQSSEGDWKLVTLLSNGWCDDSTQPDEPTCLANFGSNGAWIYGTCAVTTNGSWTQASCQNNGYNWNAAQVSNAASGGTCLGGASGGCVEVWRDERTNLVWSAPHMRNASGYNWFQASGYTRNSSTAADLGYEAQPNQGTHCRNDMTGAPEACQPTTPVSACADAGTIAGLNGVATYQNPDGTNGTVDESINKGGMTGATRQWRLSTIEDFKLADVNGFRKVMGYPDTCFWSASSVSNGRNSAWYWCGYSGDVYRDGRLNSYGVVCVGR